jgi:hypothetical protein
MSSQPWELTRASLVPFAQTLPVSQLRDQDVGPRTNSEEGMHAYALAGKEQTVRNTQEEYIVCWDNEVEIDSCTATSEQQAIDTIAEKYSLCTDDLIALPASQRHTLYRDEAGYDGI